MTNDELQNVINDLLDLCVDPIANMMCSMLVMQVRKGQLTRDEARFVIASSMDVITQAKITVIGREVGANMLSGMLKALEAQTS